MSYPNLITYKSVTKNLTEWARFAGMSPQALRMRLDHGWSMADALNTPIRPIRRKRMIGQLAEQLPGLSHYQLEVKAAQRELETSYRLFAQAMRRQMDALNREVEARLTAQHQMAIDAVTPRVGQNFCQSACEHSPSSAQETT